MKIVDYIFIICIVSFCIYGIYLGVQAITTIRQKSINNFNLKRKQIKSRIKKNGKN